MRSKAISFLSVDERVSVFSIKSLYIIRDERDSDVRSRVHLGVTGSAQDECIPSAVERQKRLGVE